MHATFVTLWLQVMQPLANVHEIKWMPHVKRESDVAVHIIAVVQSAPSAASVHAYSYIQQSGRSVKTKNAKKYEKITDS